MTVSGDDVRAFVQHLLSRDRAAAIDLVMGLADRGTPPADLLTQLIGPAQAEIGDRWHRNECSVADEHAATAISETCVALLAAHDAVRPPAELSVAVVCPDGEWHALAARLTAEVLHDAGCDVHLLGGSLPAAHLERFIAAVGPDVVALSCSTPLSFDGVLDAVHVAHAAGIPVMAGGRGLGPDDRRAIALGADLWAPSGQAAADLMSRPLPTSLRQPTADVGRAIQLAAARGAVVDAAVRELAVRLPAFERFSDEQKARTREDFTYILQYAEAALLVDDRRLFAEFLAWLDELLAGRGLPPNVLGVSLDVLNAVTTDDDVLAVIASATSRRALKELGASDAGEPGPGA